MQHVQCPIYIQSIYSTAAKNNVQIWTRCTSLLNKSTVYWCSSFHCWLHHSIFGQWIPQSNAVWDECRMMDESSGQCEIWPSEHVLSKTFRFLSQMGWCCNVYSLNKKEWICSLFKEWILEKSEIRVNLEWHLVLFTILEWPQGSLRDSDDPWGHSKMSEITHMFSEHVLSETFWFTALKNAQMELMLFRDVYTRTC